MSPAGIVVGYPTYDGEIHDAALTGNLAKVKALIAVNPSLVSSTCCAGNVTPLHLAALNGHRDVVEFLLANQADANVRASGSGNVTPLHLAALNGHIAVAELLLTNRADVRATVTTGETALHSAVSNDHKDVVELADKGYRDMVELLLAHGADVIGTVQWSRVLLG